MEEVFKICEANISEIFDSVISATGHDTAQDLLAELLRLLDTLKVKERVRESAGDSEKLQKLVPDMIVPGRTDNFIVSVDSNILAKIIEDSWA